MTIITPEPTSFGTKGGEIQRTLLPSLHQEGPVDIRAPDVSYDAKSVLFSMRIS